MIDIRTQGAEQLKALFDSWQQPAYRLEQLLGWLYARWATRWDEMTNLPRALRQKLEAAFALSFPRLVRKQGSPDATVKFLWELADHALIESVLIRANPALYGEPSDRHTLCVSTQVGCAYGCRFCASGLDGWKRNLNVEEIVNQVLAVERWHASEATEPGFTDAPPNAGSRGADSRVVSNLVIMGMGEPLANYENLMIALRILNAPWGGRHRRAQDHGIYQRPGPANPEAG